AANNISASLNDSVTITLPTYTIGGNITGLTGTVILQNNGGDDLSRSTDGSFTFSTPLHDSDTYNVTVSSQPVGQICTASDNTGTVSSSNITNIVINCVNSADTTAPTVTAFEIPSTSTSLTFPITAFTATDNVGVTGYLLTESGTTPSSGDPNWSATPQTNYTFSTEGIKTLYAWAKDAANNISASLNDSVTITLLETGIEDEVGETVSESGEVEIDDPTINLSDGRDEMDNEKRIYAKDRKISFKGKTQGLENGKVKIYVDGEVEKEIQIDSLGYWKEKIKFKKETTYSIKFEYYDLNDDFVSKSDRYRLKIDTKDPEFEDMPMVLNKKAGDKIWWNALDDYKVDYYKFYFNGQKIKTKDNFFFVDNNTPKGVHTLLIRAYDKSGNKTNKVVLVRVR
ncbi:MAG: hypothetical protein V3574_04745, partial [Candidatus Moraniibacteriota bacterium]